jgi:hypothetical protein
MGGLDQAFTGQAERDARPTSVLVARITGDDHPSDRSKEEARIRCLEALMQAAEISGGRVLRRQRDTVLVLLGSPDAAIAAATRMQAYAGAPREGGPYGVRIGVASGAVRQRHDEVVGDPVNLALQFSRQARNGQILASEATTTRLSASVQTAVGVAGAAEEGGAREILWHHKAVALLSVQKESGGGRARSVLWLQHRGKEMLRRREIEYVSFGRDARSQIVVTSQLASRRHCTISRHEGGFVLQDHSRNGTYLMVAGEGELFVHSHAAPLGKEGWICLGASADDSDEVIQYKLLVEA